MKPGDLYKTVSSGEISGWIFKTDEAARIAVDRYRMGSAFPWPMIQIPYNVVLFYINDVYVGPDVNNINKGLQFNTDHFVKFSDANQIIYMHPNVIPNWLEVIHEAR